MKRMRWPWKMEHKERLDEQVISGLTAVCLNGRQFFCVLGLTGKL